MSGLVQAVASVSAVLRKWDGRAGRRGQECVALALLRQTELTRPNEKS